MSSADPRAQFWYRRFRTASYIAASGTLILTFLIVLPFPPFSYLPPVIVGGGAGTWFIISYFLLLTVGVGGFGVLSSFIYTIELHEGRSIDSRLMWPAFLLLGFGLATSCCLLAIAGAVGGYTATIGTLSSTSVDILLSPYVYPITVSTLVAVAGAALALCAMIRAGWQST